MKVYYELNEKTWQVSSSSLSSLQFDCVRDKQIFFSRAQRINVEIGRE